MDLTTVALSTNTGGDVFERMKSSVLDSYTFGAIFQMCQRPPILRRPEATMLPEAIGEVRRRSGVENPGTLGGLAVSYSRSRLGDDATGYVSVELGEPLCSQEGLDRLRDAVLRVEDIYDPGFGHEGRVGVAIVLDNDNPAYELSSLEYRVSRVGGSLEYEFRVGATYDGSTPPFGPARLVVRDGEDKKVAGVVADEVRRCLNNSPLAEYPRRRV